MHAHSSLYRSRQNRILGGVCGGLSQKLSFDVSIIRLLFVLLALFGGGGLLIYIVMWIIVPEEPLPFPGQGSQQAYSYNAADEAGGEWQDPKNTENFDSGRSFQMVLGIGLVVAGFLFLISNFVSWFNISDLWPAVLIFVGIALLFSQSSSKK